MFKKSLLLLALVFGACRLSYATNWPDIISLDSNLYIAVNNCYTALNGNHTSGATTITALDTSCFPSVGFITIDDEAILYTGKTGTTFTGCTRASDGTSAAAHTTGATVFHAVIAKHHNALKDELISMSTYFFQGSTIHIDTTNVRVGIGTATPSTALHVTGGFSLRNAADNENLRGGVTGLEHETRFQSFLNDSTGTATPQINIATNLPGGACEIRYLAHEIGTADGFDPSTEMAFPYMLHVPPVTVAGTQHFVMSRDDGGTKQALVLDQTGGFRIGTGAFTVSAGVSASLDLNSTDRALITNRLTTAQRDALTAVDGMILYNSTLNRMQNRESSAWVTNANDSLVVHLAGSETITGNKAFTSTTSISNSSYPQLSIDDATSRTYAVGVTGGTFRIRDVTGAADRITLSSGGNVGIGNTVPGTTLHISSGTIKGDGNVSPSISVNNAVLFGSKTTVQLEALTPSSSGEVYFCTDCTTPNLFISTGTTQGAWVNVADGTTAN